MGDFTIQPLPGRPFHVFARVAESDQAILSSRERGDGLVDRFAGRTGVAERIYLEWPSEKPLRPTAIKGTVAPLRSWDLADDNTAVTLEAQLPALRETDRRSLRETGVSRLVIVFGEDDVQVEMNAVRDLAADFELSLELHARHWRETFQQNCRPEIQKLVSEMTVPHVSFLYDPSDQVTGGNFDVLELTARELQRLGMRRLSPTTFGLSNRESPMMAHIRSGGEYLGVGAGAASMFIAPEGVVRTRQPEQPGGAAFSEQVGPLDHLRELIMLQYPSDRGFSPTHAFRRMPGLEPRYRYSLVRRLHKALDEGHAMELEFGRFRPTLKQGWARAEETIRRLWAEINRLNPDSE